MFRKETTGASKEKSVYDFDVPARRLTVTIEAWYQARSCSYVLQVTKVVALHDTVLHVAALSCIVIEASRTPKSRPETVKVVKSVFGKFCPCDGVR